MEQIISPITRQPLSSSAMKRRTLAKEKYIPTREVYPKKYNDEVEIESRSRNVFSTFAKLACYPFIQEGEVNLGLHLSRLNPFRGICFIEDVPKYLQANPLGFIPSYKISATKLP